MLPALARVLEARRVPGPDLVRVAPVATLILVAVREVLVPRLTSLTEEPAVTFKFTISLLLGLAWSLSVSLAADAPVPLRFRLARAVRPPALSSAPASISIVPVLEPSVRKRFMLPLSVGPKY